MPRYAADMPLQTSQRATFALPCTVVCGVAYLGDPAVVLGALPGVERIVLRQRGTYRVTLSPIHVPGVSLRPAAEINFTTTDQRVVIRSVAEELHDLQPGEVATHVSGLFTLVATDVGCDIQAILQIAATVPARALPALMPRAIAQATAETVLAHRIKQEVHAMTQALVSGYRAWNKPK